MFTAEILRSPGRASSSSGLDVMAILVCPWLGTSVRPSQSCDGLTQDEHLRRLIGPQHFEYSNQVARNLAVPCNQLHGFPVFLFKLCCVRIPLVYSEHQSCGIMMSYPGRSIDLLCLERNPYNMTKFARSLGMDNSK